MPSRQRWEKRSDFCAFFCQSLSCSRFICSMRVSPSPLGILKLHFDRNISARVNSKYMKICCFQPRRIELINFYCSLCDSSFADFGGIRAQQKNISNKTNFYMKLFFCFSAALFQYSMEGIVDDDCRTWSEWVITWTTASRALSFFSCLFVSK